MTETVPLVFYQYRQNNSGGSHEINENVTLNVYVQASSPEEADARAKRIGIYFDGVDNNVDCECCGDRWIPAVGYAVTILDATELVVSPYDGQWVSPGGHVAIFHYLDGHREYYEADGAQII